MSGVGGAAPLSDLKEAWASFRYGSKKMLLEGYQQVRYHLGASVHVSKLTCFQNKGRPFYVPTPMGERLMLPSNYIEELKNEPNEKADFPATFVEVDLC